MQAYPEWDFNNGHKPCLNGSEAVAAKAALPEGTFPHLECVTEGKCGFYAMCNFAHKRSAQGTWEPPTLPQSVIMGPAPESRLIIARPALATKVA